MIAIDTNVLVRFLVTDDKGQSDRAAAVFRHAVETDQPLFVSDIVLCETVWVLQSVYRVKRNEIVKTLSDLLRARHLSFQHGDALHRSARAFGAGRGDFADYLIAERAREAGCATVLTFDKTLLREPGFDSP